MSQDTYFSVDFAANAGPSQQSWDLASNSNNVFQTSSQHFQQQQQQQEEEQEQEPHHQNHQRYVLLERHHMEGRASPELFEEDDDQDFDMGMDDDDDDISGSDSGDMESWRGPRLNLKTSGFIFSQTQRPTMFSSHGPPGEMIEFDDDGDTAMSPSSPEFRGIFAGMDGDFQKRSKPESQVSQETRATTERMTSTVVNNTLSSGVHQNKEGVSASEACDQQQRTDNSQHVTSQSQKIEEGEDEVTVDVSEHSMDNEFLGIAYDTEDDESETSERGMSYESDDLEYHKSSEEENSDHEQPEDHHANSSTHKNRSVSSSPSSGFKKSSSRAKSTSVQRLKKKKAIPTKVKKATVFKIIDEDSESDVESDEEYEGSTGTSPVVETVTRTTTTTTTRKKQLVSSSSSSSDSQPRLSESRRLQMMIDHVTKEVLNESDGITSRRSTRHRNKTQGSGKSSGVKGRDKLKSVKNMYSRDAFETNLTQALSDLEGENDHEVLLRSPKKKQRSTSKVQHGASNTSLRTKNKKQSRKTINRQSVRESSVLMTAASEGIEVKYRFFSGIIFLLSKINGDQKDKLTRMILRANGQIYNQFNFDPEESEILYAHEDKQVVLVAGEMSTTPKYLMSLALSVPIVNIEWIRDCYRNKELMLSIRDRKYLLPCGEIDHNVADFLDIQKNKRRQLQKIPIDDLHVCPLEDRLFNGKRIAVEGSMVFKINWISILRASGAKVNDSYHHNYASLDYVVSDNATDSVLQQATLNRVPVVIPAYFTQSLIYDDILDPTSELFMCNRNHWRKMYGDTPDAEGLISSSQEVQDMEQHGLDSPPPQSHTENIPSTVAQSQLSKPTFRCEPYQIGPNGIKLYSSIELGNGREVVLGDVVQLSDGFFGIVQSLQEDIFQKKTVRYLMLCTANHVGHIMKSRPKDIHSLDKELFLTEEERSESVEIIVPHVRVVLLQCDNVQFDRFAPFLPSETSSIPMTIVKHCSRRVAGSSSTLHTDDSREILVDMNSKNHVQWNQSGYNTALKTIKMVLGE